MIIYFLVNKRFINQLGRQIIKTEIQSLRTMMHLYFCIPVHGLVKSNGNRNFAITTQSRLWPYETTTSYNSFVLYNEKLNSCLFFWFFIIIIILSIYRHFVHRYRPNRLI